MKRSIQHLLGNNDDVFARRARNCVARLCSSTCPLADNMTSINLSQAEREGDDPKMTSSLDLLGEDGLIRLAFGFLDVRDHQMVRSCCKKWRNLVKTLELDVLDISNRSSLNAANIDRAFLSIVHNYSSVRRINLSGQRSLSDRDLLVMASCFWADLEEIVVDDCLDITDFGLLSIFNAQSQKLRVISMRHCKRITGGFAYTQIIGKHPSLEVVDFHDTRISFGLVDNLERAFSSLRRVIATHTPAHLDFFYRNHWEDLLYDLMFLVSNQHGDVRHLNALLKDLNERCIRTRSTDKSKGIFQQSMLSLGKRLLIDAPLQQGDFCSALLYASENGLTGIIEPLLKIGQADIEVTDKDGASPLCVAAASGVTEIVRLLLLNHADINKRTYCLATPLYIASEMDWEDIVDMLLDANAFTDCAVVGGATALCVAAKNGNRTIVRRLIEQAPVKPRGQVQFIQALFLACERGHADIAEDFLNYGVDPNVLMDNSVTPLYLACQMGHDGVVILLLRRGADPNFRRPNGVSCLYIAAQEGKHQIVDYLMEHGVNIHAKMEDLSTALHIAARMGHISVAQILLREGACIDDQTRSGLTPLYIAAEEGHLMMVEFFLKNNAGLNIQTKNGTTPLFVASQKGHAIIVRVLLEAGANAQLPKNNGTYPMDAASLLGNYEVTKLLLKYGARVGGLSLHFAERRKDLKLQALLMDRYYAQHIQQNELAVSGLS